MGLEAGTYISDLNSSNPVGASDPKSQGDDHIRLIKSTILATFPNITGAVTLTHTQLNEAARLSAANAFTGNNTVDGTLGVLGGNALEIYDSTNTDKVAISHNGTDLNIVGTTTTDINISGITAINAGAVDVDFDAITATSYGGITEANLVDKSAAETITGTWTFTTINVTTIAGITATNLVDKSAAETITGTWGFSAITVTTINSEAASEIVYDSNALSYTVTDSAQPGYVGIPSRSISASASLALSDSGRRVYLTGGSGQTLTIPANASVAFPVGTTIEVMNDSGNNWSIAITTDTLEWLGVGGTGTRTLQDNNKAILEKVTSTLWKISGSAGLA